MKDKILGLLAENGKLPRDEIKPEHRLAEDLQIDSITLLMLVMRLESETGSRFDDEKLAKIKTVADVMDLVAD